MTHPTTFINDMRSLSIRAVSADRRLAVNITGIVGTPAVRFPDHGAYEHFQRFGGLDNALTAIVNEACDTIAQEREQLIRTRSRLRIIDDDRMPDDRRQRIDAIADIEAHGESVDGLIEATTWGQRDWEFQVHPGALDNPMAACTTAISTAITIACRSHQEQLRTLRSQW